jgi:hypothetical protein
MEQYRRYIKNFVLILIILLSLYLLYRVYSIRYDNYSSKINTLKFGISTTVKNPHQLNDWIKYHLNIGFHKLYIVFDDENENTNYVTNNNQVNIFKNNTDWKKQLEQLPNMDQYINEKKEVMSRQILNFTNVRNYAKLDNVDFLLHIDADELFYPENKDLESIFNNKYDVITFQNLEMIPSRDNYENCFKDAINFKINPGIFNAYSNGKSAVKVNSDAIIAGVHDFWGGTKIFSPIGKILHYPSCNFDEYINKYKILGKFDDKWWNSVQIPFKFHTESRDLITECSAKEANGEINACENSVRLYYNKSNVLNDSYNINDIMEIDYVNSILK